MNQAGTTAAQDLLAAWFGDLAAPPPAARTAWFTADPAHDQALAARFGHLVEAALSGGLDAGWPATPHGRLAQVLLLDQLPRNLFRGSARAFAGDAMARALARAAIDAGDDDRLPPFGAAFLYLPFEHGESRCDQRLAVALFECLASARGASEPALAAYVEHARAHAAIVERFGRFPHRNTLLGRADTPAEAEFLERDARRFGTRPAGAG
jgi:uncharacterized protein (DUF924 family)